MRSFEHNYFLDQPISHELLIMVRLIGEYRGRQDLYRRQSPEALEMLRRVAMVQSVESSNRIEGIALWCQAPNLTSSALKNLDKRFQNGYKIGSNGQTASFYDRL